MCIGGGVASCCQDEDKVRILRDRSNAIFKPFGNEKEQACEQSNNGAYEGREQTAPVPMFALFNQNPVRREDFQE